MFKKKLLFLLCLMVFLSVLGYVIAAVGRNGKSNQQNIENMNGTEEERKQIVTSFYPMYILTKNLTKGTKIQVSNLTENQTGCLHDYQLTTKDMKLLSKADMLVLNGAGMEEFLDHVLENQPELTIITTSKNIGLLQGYEHTHAHTHGASEDTHTEEEHTHTEEEHAHTASENTHTEKEHTHTEEEHAHTASEDTHTEEEHTHTEEEHAYTASEDTHTEEEHTHTKNEHAHTDAENGHVWLDVERYRIQAKNLYQALVLFDEEQRAAYFDAYQTYDAKLEQLSERVDELSKKTEGRKVVIFHDAFAYLAESLHMDVIARISLDDDVVPSAGEIAEVIEKIKLHQQAILMIEEEYRNYADKIASEADVTVLCLNPLTKGTGEEDSYLNGMSHNLEEIEHAEKK